MLSKLKIFAKSILNHRLTLKIFIFFKCCQLYRNLSLLRLFILQKKERRSFESIGNHQLMFWSSKSKIRWKFLLFSKYCRLYSKLIITTFIYLTKREEIEKEALNQLQIIDLHWKFLFPSNIIDYIHIITMKDGEGSFKSIPNHRLMFWPSKSKIRLYSKLIIIIIIICLFILHKKRRRSTPNHPIIQSSSYVFVFRIFFKHYRLYSYHCYKRRKEGALYQLEIINFCFDLPSRKAMKILTFFKILSIIYELYNYYIYLSYKRKKEQEIIIDQGK